MRCSRSGSVTLTHRRRSRKNEAPCARWSHPPPLAVAGARAAPGARGRRASRSASSSSDDDTLGGLQRPLALRRRDGLRRLQQGHRHRAQPARRHRARAVRAAEARGRRHAGRRARHHRPRQPLAGRERTASSPPSTSPTLEANVPEALRDPGSQWWPLTVRLRVPVVSTERVGRGRDHQLRGPRRSEVEGSHVPAHVEQRVQPVARRRLPRQARPRGDRRRCCSRGWTTTRRSTTATASCSR